MSNVLVLIGFKMSGKTTYGRALAAASARQFIDVDYLMEEAHCAAGAGRRAAFEIYRDLGAQEFYRLERESVAHLSEIDDAVVSTAGSTILDPENLRLLQQVGPVVLIDTPRTTIKQRWFSGRLPQFIDPNDKDNAFDTLYRARAPLYRAAADVVVPTHGLSTEQVVDRLLEAERKHRGKGAPSGNWQFR